MSRLAGQAPARAMDWRPTASREALQLRAQALARARQYLAQRDVLEVTTPVMVRAAVSDVHLASARVSLPGDEQTDRFLQTSPEYAMKRLLAAGSGDIYQICQVIRGFERGRLHNCEFTLIEWYRAGYTLEQLMSEVHGLIEAITGAAWAAEHLSYAQAFERHLKLDPLNAPLERLRAGAIEHGLARKDAHLLSRDGLLDFLLTACIARELGQGRLCFLHRYPASQAALARLDPADSRVSLRFELYLEGIELANGFDELTDRPQQQARFEEDLRERARLGLPEVRLDQRLLAALEHGMPACSGVALGLDRLIMLAGGYPDIDAVMAFPDEIA